MKFAEKRYYKNVSVLYASIGWISLVLTVVLLFIAVLNTPSVSGVQTLGSLRINLFLVFGLVFGFLYSFCSLQLKRYSSKRYDYLNEIKENRQLIKVKKIIELTRAGKFDEADEIQNIEDVSWLFFIDGFTVATKLNSSDLSVKEEGEHTLKEFGL